MSGLPDSWKDSADLMEEDKRLMEELVTNVCFRLLSHKEPNTPNEEDSRETDNKICLKQRRESTIKQLVTKFFEDREKASNISNNDKTYESNNVEDNFTENKNDAETEIRKENTTEVDISTGNEINDIASLIKTSSSEEKEINTLHPVTEEEESLESKICIHEENKICNEDANKTSEAVGDGMNDNFILKIESSGETEKEINHIGLTPEEEEEIKSLILLAESNYSEEVSIKTELEEDTISHCITSTKSELNNNNNTGGCKECLKSESDLDDATLTCKHDTGETLEGLMAKRSKYQPTHVLSPPMGDVRSPFHINQKIVPVKFYEENLVCNRWNPTQVLYELCVQCNWQNPEFRMIEFSNKEGFWYSVKVNNHNFVSYKKARSKSEAKNLASARFLKFLGLKFSYEALTKSDRLRSRHISPWSEKYSNYNSSSLSKEEERRKEFRCTKGSRELESDIDNFCCYKRKRSSSNDSRNSKIIRASSPEMRRDIVKRKRRSDDRVLRLKSRRDISPEYSHRKPYLRMDHEEHRRHRLVHERIAVTHVYDCKTSHSGQSRSDRESARRKRYHPSYDN